MFGERWYIRYHTQVGALVHRVGQVGLRVARCIQEEFNLAPAEGCSPRNLYCIGRKTDMKFVKTVAEVKKLAALNSAVDKTSAGQEPAAGAFFSKYKPERGTTKKKGWKARPNQCFWCLDFGHMVQKCPNREKGEDPKPHQKTKGN